MLNSSCFGAFIVWRRGDHVLCCAVPRYVRYMGNIRLIQEYLVRKADKYCVPRVDNSNVDRSVGIIHLAVMRCGTDRWQQIGVCMS